MSKTAKIYNDWLENHDTKLKNKHLWLFTEKQLGRVKIQDRLAEAIRSHYLNTERIAKYIKELKFKRVAKRIEKKLPKNENVRKGDLGEILAMVLVEEKLDMEVPIKRLRFKDGRDVPIRGDDIIGVKRDEQDNLLTLLKGEAKSGVSIDRGVVRAARTQLNSNDGKCSDHTLYTIVDLLDHKGSPADEQLSEKIDASISEEIQVRTDHLLFTLSGNEPYKSLQNDFNKVDNERKHFIANVRVHDHESFIQEMFELAAESWRPKPV